MSNQTQQRNNYFTSNTSSFCADDWHDVNFSVENGFRIAIDADLARIVKFNLPTNEEQAAAIGLWRATCSVVKKNPDHAASLQPVKDGLRNYIKAQRQLFSDQPIFNLGALRL